MVEFARKFQVISAVIIVILGFNAFLSQAEVAVFPTALGLAFFVLLQNHINLIEDEEMFGEMFFWYAIFQAFPLLAFVFGFLIQSFESDPMLPYTWIIAFIGHILTMCGWLIVVAGLASIWYKFSLRRQSTKSKNLPESDQRHQLLWRPGSDGDLEGYFNVDDIHYVPRNKDLFE